MLADVKDRFFVWTVKASWCLTCYGWLHSGRKCGSGCHYCYGAIVSEKDEYRRLRRRRNVRISNRKRQWRTCERNLLAHRNGTAAHSPCSPYLNLSVLIKKLFFFSCWSEITMPILGKFVIRLNEQAENDGRMTFVKAIKRNLSSRGRFICRRRSSVKVMHGKWSGASSFSNQCSEYGRRLEKRTQSIVELCVPDLDSVVTTP